MPIFAPFSFLEQKDIIPAIDADVQAFLTATGITDPTIEAALDTFVTDLKTNGLWTKMNAIYPFVGGTATTHKYNLVDPQDTDAAFRLTFVGGMTHSSTGVVSNGSTGYADTHMNASTDIGGGQDDIHMMSYEDSVTAINGATAGARNNTQWIFFNTKRASDNSFVGRASTASAAVIAHSVTQGAFGISRTSSANFIGFVNTTKSTVTATSSALPNFDIYIGGAYNNFGTASAFTARTSQLYTLGSGLSSSEIDTLVSAAAQLQTDLGR